MDRTDNIALIEERQELLGALEGVLPFGREFEFRVAATGESIWGTIGPEVEDPAFLNALVGQPSRIHVLLTRFGEGRPRYVLIAPPESLIPAP